MMFAKASQRIYRILETGHRLSYDFGFLDRLQLRTPVLSVGNLTMGGTGKTPFVQYLVEQLQQRGRRCGIVSLNYQAQIRKPALVDRTHPKAAYYYGDEPTLLANHFPQMPVMVGPRKWESALQLEATGLCDTIILDDGFQHHALARDLDFVLIDASAPLEDLELLPVGRARESLGALKRSDYLVLTRVNQAQEPRISQLLAMLPAEMPVMQMSSQLQGEFLEETGRRVFGFAGIGRPESFEASLKNESFYELVGFQGFPDHYNYQIQDLERLRQMATDAGAELLITTEKDAVKIRSLNPDMTGLRVLPLLFKPVFGEESFHEFLDKRIAEWMTWKKFF
ncbi:MAG: tetraacyldisaccharide 4'-kinase [Bdellovibrio sp.]